MGQKLKKSEQEALDYLYGGGDEVIEYQSASWVIIRFSQICCSVYHQTPVKLLKGSNMVRETARVEGQFGSCYTCESCIQKAFRELCSHS